MNSECYPISLLPRLSRLFLDFTRSREPLEPYYSSSPYGNGWMQTETELSAGRRATLCELLEAQNLSSIGHSTGSNPSSRIVENLRALRNGAGAVVTGQQTTLFGGPLYTLLKAATAIRKAEDASAAGHPHVPIFWLASEDHDLAEANQVTLPAGKTLRTLHLKGEFPDAAPAGGLPLGEEIAKLVEQVQALAADHDPTPAGEALWGELAACYRPQASFAGAFAGLIRKAFSAYGLIVIDASQRPFHALGAKILREAIVRAAELREALEDRGRELVAAGYHAQVLVAPESSLLFLIDRDTGARLPLRATGNGDWQAGRQSFSSEELLAILDQEPERLSPNALLRPVFQDAILPTSAYIGGPSEVAYFAQANVLYDRLLHRSTAILPRLSATLIEPEVAEVMRRRAITLPELVEIASGDPRDLAQALALRSLSAEGQEKLQAAGEALDRELTALVHYFGSLREDVKKSAETSASKMQYQMSRLRRLAANYQLQQDGSIEQDAQSLQLHLFPDRRPQERVLGSIWFLSHYPKTLIPALVEAAGQECPGHRAISLSREDRQGQGKMP